MGASVQYSSGLINTPTISFTGSSASSLTFITAVPAPVPFSGIDTIRVAIPPSFPDACFGTSPYAGVTSLSGIYRLRRLGRLAAAIVAGLAAVIAAVIVAGLAAAGLLPMLTRLPPLGQRFSLKILPL
ncbi:MAG: hypothetical protein COX65_07185 [Elusimicrobia bacterium CG_4_10_14_0_2_um_filter_56_8]|nr:MAG: hypothetical protein AUJ51_04830 [Elusimicrobia bacterium CG1_02_56_21]PJA13337.1 MAG: hypothetical protein COX65_07185 [Elusimicrobia bacterium CG_4_10_14_0_2_um_filter_56_8]